MRRCRRSSERDLGRRGLHFCGRAWRDRAELVLAEVGVRLLRRSSFQISVGARLVDGRVGRLSRRRWDVLAEEGCGALKLEEVLFGLV